MNTKYLQTSKALETLIQAIEWRGLDQKIIWSQDDGTDMLWPEIKAYLLSVDREERKSLMGEWPYSKPSQRQDEELQSHTCSCPEWKKEIMLKELGEDCCKENNKKS